MGFFEFKYKEPDFNKNKFLISNYQQLEQIELERDVYIKNHTDEKGVPTCDIDRSSAFTVAITNTINQEKAFLRYNAILDYFDDDTMESLDETFKYNPGYIKRKVIRKAFGALGYYYDQKSVYLDKKKKYLQKKKVG